MEITNEIKAKVFAQYLGQYSYKDYSAQGLGIRREKLVGVEENGIIWIWDALSHRAENRPDAKLILKPLSSITDEDAIEVAKLQQEYEQKEEIRVAFSIDEKNNGCLDCLIEYKGYSHDYWQPVYSPTFQYLQSKGYDLPNYLLGGKTLKEAGLAIYE
jgi:hypothetical protein